MRGLTGCPGGPWTPFCPLGPAGPCQRNEQELKQQPQSWNGEERGRVSLGVCTGGSDTSGEQGQSSLGNTYGGSFGSFGTSRSLQMRNKRRGKVTTQIRRGKTWGSGHSTRERKGRGLQGSLRGPRSRRMGHAGVRIRAGQKGDIWGWRLER